MNTNEPRQDPNRDPADGGNVITPLEGEAGIPSVVRPTGVNVSRKGILRGRPARAVPGRGLGGLDQPGAGRQEGRRRGLEAAW